MRESILNSWRIVLILILSSCVLSCKNTKKVITTTNYKVTQIDTARVNLLNKLRGLEMDYRTCQIKADVSLETQGANLNIRMRKSSELWMSAGMLGFEGVRVLMTQDSLKLLNKMEDNCLLKPTEYISELIGFNVSVDEIQNLLLGVCSKRFIEDSLTIQKDSVKIVLTSNGSKKIKLVFNNQYILKQFSLGDTLGRNINIDYVSHAMVQGRVLPKEIRVQVEQKSKITRVLLSYNRIVFNTDIETPFQIPRRIRKKM